MIRDIWAFFLAQSDGKQDVIVPLCATLKFCCFGKWLSVIGAYNHRQFIKLANKLISVWIRSACRCLSLNCVCAHLSRGCFGAATSFPFCLASIPLSLSVFLSLLFGLQSRWTTGDQRRLTRTSTCSMDCVSKPLPAVQLCHFLLRVSPEMTKWLGRLWHEKVMTECFRF